MKVVVTRAAEPSLRCCADKGPVANSLNTVQWTYLIFTVTEDPERIRVESSVQILSTQIRWVRKMVGKRSGKALLREEGKRDLR